MGNSSSSRDHILLDEQAADVAEPTATSVTPHLKIYTYAQLKRATGNFNPRNMLRENCLGRVYKGWVDEGTLAPSSKNGVGIPVAVRKSNPGQRLLQWEVEAEFLGRFSHPNIVKLLGYYRDDKQFLLVYEYMHKGSLENHLFRNGGAGHLSWQTRLKIAIGAAQGLVFLYTNKQVMYRSFQTAMILLDRDFNAKLSDFGRVKFQGHSRFSTNVGIDGDQITADHPDLFYAPPEYVATGHYSDDVYSFGLVLLEMITGQRVFDRSRPSQQFNLANWAKPYLLKKDALNIIMDPNLQGQYPINAAFETSQLILKCLEYSKTDRPSINDVLQALERINAINMAPQEQ
ncbi:hypothetical protein ACET3Z_031221 [Daucus carota]